MLKRRGKKKAFTLVELLIVIAVIAILFIVLISKVNFATDRAKDSGVLTDFRSYQIGVQHAVRENNVDMSMEEDEIVGYINKNLDKKLRFTEADVEDGSEYQSSVLNPYGYKYVFKKIGTTISIYSIKNQGDTEEVLELGSAVSYADEVVYSAGKKLVWKVINEYPKEMQISSKDTGLAMQVKGSKKVESGKILWDKYSVETSMEYTGETKSAGVTSMITTGSLKLYKSISVDRITGAIVLENSAGTFYIGGNASDFKGDYFMYEGYVCEARQKWSGGYGTIAKLDATKLVAVGSEVQNIGVKEGTVAGNEGDYPDNGIQDGYWYIKVE